MGLLIINIQRKREREKNEMWNWFPNVVETAMSINLKES